MWLLQNIVYKFLFHFPFRHWLSVTNSFMSHLISFPWCDLQNHKRIKSRNDFIPLILVVFIDLILEAGAAWPASHGLILAHKNVLLNHRSILEIGKFCESFLIFDFSWKSKKKKKPFNMGPQLHTVISSWMWFVSATASTYSTASRLGLFIDSNCLQSIYIFWLSEFFSDLAPSTIRT